MLQREQPMKSISSGFSTLPRDIKFDIFDLIRSKYDQGNVRLVNQDCNSLMRPRMWRNFTTRLLSDFATNAREQSPEQDACLHKIRALTVGGRHAGPEYDTRFPRFVHRLRDDHLLEFNSGAQTPLDVVQLLNLLRHQSILRTFRARFDLSDVCAEAMSSWTTEQDYLFKSSLRSLKSLRIYIGDQSNEGNHPQALYELEMACSSLLVSTASSLECLEICGWRHTWDQHRPRISLTALFRSASNPFQIPGTLTHILLADTDLFDAEYELMRAIRLDRLRSLKLEYCDNMGSFLVALASSIRQTKVQIKVLTFRARKHQTYDDRTQFTGGIEDVLQSFSGLEELECESMWTLSIDWRTSLRTHHTLNKLSIISSRLCDAKEDSAGKTAQILEACPNLQHFSFFPTLMFLGYVADCELPSSMGSRYYDLLDAVAAAPSLHSIRMTHAPGLMDNKSNRRDQGWIQNASQMAQDYARMVFTHLHRKGSNVRLLALSPTSRWQQAYGDSNIHYYPHYFYKLRIFELDDKKTVEAIPLQDYAAECPDAAVFV